MRKQFNKLRNNPDSGYSMIEMIIIVTIIMVIIAVLSGSMVQAFRSRSNSAASKVESLISKSKVNAMSGRKNLFKLRYDTNDECYYAELFDVTDDDSSVYEAEPYESVEIGTEALNIKVNGTVDVKEGPITLAFKSGIGYLDFAENAGGDSIITDEKQVVIRVYYGSSYTITIFANTGSISR